MARKKRKFTTEETSDFKSSTSKKKAKVATTTESVGSKPPSPKKKRKSTTEEISDSKSSASKKKAKASTTTDTAPLGSKTPSPKKKRRRQKFGRTEPSPPTLAVHIDPKVAQALSPETQKVLLSELNTINPKIRPVDETGQHTPNKTLVTSLVTFGPFIISDTRSKAPTDAKKIKSDSTFHMLKALGSKKAKENKKIKAASITKPALAKIKKQNAEQGRVPRQDEVMGEEYDKPRISANEAAKLHGFDEKIGWEWGHLIAHRFLDNEEAQKPDNLVLMTGFCNTLMMFVEDEVEKLINSLKDNTSTVDLTVTSDLDPETNIATYITYNIKSTPLNFDLTLSFNPLSTYRPQQTLEDVAKAIFQTAQKIKKPLICIPDKKEIVYDATRLDNSTAKTDVTSTLETKNEEDVVKATLKPLNLEQKFKDTIEITKNEEKSIANSVF